MGRERPSPTASLAEQSGLLEPTAPLPPPEKDLSSPGTLPLDLLGHLQDLQQTTLQLAPRGSF